ncbi:hypothetical protein BH09PAT4_BH09PAT4_08640 [soil metagenome]
MLPLVANRCYRCRALSPGGLTCRSCRRSSKLYRVRAVTRYELLAKELLGKLKFSGARAAARTIASVMAEQFEVPAEVVVLHVPTATSRVRLRGYDQAALIAKQFAYLTGANYQSCLRRVGQHRQVGASRAQRLAQMQQSFEVSSRADIVGRHIFLIDDVMTTGATLEAAAATLRAAGAKRVEAIVFARA